jgi:hypothetical protein
VFRNPGQYVSLYGVVKVTPNCNTLPAFNEYFYYLNQSMRKKWKLLFRGVFNSIYGNVREKQPVVLQRAMGFLKNF